MTRTAGDVPISDPLAHELRRLSYVVARHNTLSGDTFTSTAGDMPGELALRLASSFGLRGVDVDLALTVLGAEIDHDFAALLVEAGVRSETSLLAALLPGLEQRLAVADALGPDAPAVRLRLLRRTERDGVGHLSSTRRFRAAVLGRKLLSELPRFAELIANEPQPLWWTTAPEGLLEAMARAQTGSLCVVTGGPGVGKTTWATHAAFSIHGAALRIDAARAARVLDAADVIRELLEDASLEGIPVVIDNAGELLRGGSQLLFLIGDVLDACSVKLFVIVGDAELAERLSSRALGHVHIEPPSPLARRELWRSARTSESARNVLADDLVLTPRQIANAIALIEAGADPSLAAVEQIPKAHNLTLPDRTTSRLDALVLPDEPHREIIEIIDAIRVRGAVVHKLGSARGRAITALLNGDSGTGKTFACEVIAAEVGLPLMRVNVASLVDKYIGETEKNLVRVFAQAQAQGGILFFDEADALFGSRTEVSRAQDRYANLETNLLLQLMEQFSGVVLLTTNLKQNIDQAFMRRIMFKVYFEMPEPRERERLWRSMLPSEDFAADIDFARLARTFELSGGAIRAAALRAAYRAASARRQIVMSDLVECAQLEMQSMGRVTAW